jgi:predicted metal-dependent phosphoesterase TrpH
VRIDLHTHSSASDGTDPPAEVMARARARGLDVVALTDHDTVAGHAEARAALPPGLTLVPGMELSCTLNGRSMHLLAYLFDPAYAPLAEAVASIRDDRIRRARVMVAKLAALGTGVTWEQVTAIAGDGVVGRPHIARALAATGTIGEPAEAFTADWIGDGGRAYEDKYALDPAEAIALISQAGGVTVLAHPRSGGYEVPDGVIGELAAAGLAGLEVWHPDHSPAVRGRLRVLAAGLGLVPTGGSDDHGALTGHHLGAETTPPEAFERLTEQAAGQLIALSAGPPAEEGHQPVTSAGAAGDRHRVGEQARAGVPRHQQGGVGQ